MWIVKLAIDRPYTFVVVAILLALISIMTATHMAVDIFPNINIPVVSVVWSFTGLSPEEMESRIISVSERAMTMVTSDIEHMESVSLSGIGIIRVYLHQGADMGQAVALMSAINQMELVDMPPGITPPAVVAFSATDAPVMQLGVSSKVLTEAQLADYDLNFIRTRLATVSGAQLPLPYGGKQRLVMVDLYADKLLSKGVAPSDVVNALSAQNLILPAGLARFGQQEFPVKINDSPNRIDDFNNIPIKVINNGTIYIKDVGYAHDGNSIQTNIVRIDGKRATLLNVLRAGGHSTLKVVEGIKNTLPLVKATVPKSLDIKIVNDQSQFVRGAVNQVIYEAVIAALLTGLLMLALLGSWRSTLIVAISIPLSIMTSIIALSLCKQTLNTMTLGGLSLAVGMLVDDATVEVENIHRNLDLRLPLREAVLTSAAEVALPALVSTLSICIVFVPVTLLTEPSRSLFVPMGMAVGFAMLASYFLSRTLVPVMSTYLLKSEELPGATVPEGMTIEEAARQQSQTSLTDYDDSPRRDEPDSEELPPVGDRGGKTRSRRRSLFREISVWVDGRFRSLRRRYNAWLERALEHRTATVVMFTIFFLVSFCLIPFIGQDFFPVVDAGEMRLHLICPVGTRIDDTDLYFSRVETAIRRIIPANEIASITENMGTPASGLSLCYGDNSNYTEFDGEMLITLNQQHHGSTFQYQKHIRKMLAYDFPMLTYYFQPADITTEILDAGLEAPIDIQVTGLNNREQNYELAMAIKHDVSLIPGAVDVLVRQALHQPQINVDVDRSKSIKLGLSQHDVAASLLTSLSSSFQTSPSFWVNPANGVSYTVAVQTPLYRTRSTDDITRTLITGTSGLLATTAQAGHSGSLQSMQTGAPAQAAATPQSATPAQPAFLSQGPSSTQPALATQTVPPTLTSLSATIPVAPPAAAAQIVQELTTPSTSNIPPYLSTSSPGNSLTPNTVPVPGAPPTVAEPPSVAAEFLTTPGTLTAQATSAAATLTTPSFLSLAPYVTTFSGPAAVSAAAASPAIIPPAPPVFAGQSTSPSLAMTTSQSATSTQGLSAAQPTFLTQAGVSTPPATSVPSAQSTSAGQSPTPSTSTGSSQALASLANGLGVYAQTSTPPGVSSLLMNLSATRRTPTSAMVCHYAIQPVFDVYANTQDRDLGGVTRDVQKVVDSYRGKAPPGTLIYVRGQADSMNKAFSGLIVGIIFALVLIYLLLVINFQSWLDPLIILMAIPGALSGIVWSLFITQTTFSVPALMGAIMSIGVGSANSILLVNFANEQHHTEPSAVIAMSRAGFIRFRPVIMTAMAMTVGMLPMASGLGEGGGQNAPLGRAVIGGLIVATLCTLFFVPVVYTLLKGRNTN